jgi:hypothetical protein
VVANTKIPASTGNGTLFPFLLAVTSVVSTLKELGGIMVDINTRSTALEALVAPASLSASSLYVAAHRAQNFNCENDHTHTHTALPIVRKIQ